MAMKSVSLDEAKWTTVMTILGNSTGFSWAVTNPLLMEIGQQLAPSQETVAGLPSSLVPASRPNGPDVDAPASGRLRGGPGNRSTQA